VSLFRVLQKLVHYQPQDVTWLFHYWRQSASRYAIIKLKRSDIFTANVTVAWWTKKHRSISFGRYEFVSHCIRGGNWDLVVLLPWTAYTVSCYVKNCTLISRNWWISFRPLSVVVWYLLINFGLYRHRSDVSRLASPLFLMLAREVWKKIAVIQQKYQTGNVRVT